MFKYRNNTTLEIIYDDNIFISKQMPGFSPAAQSIFPIYPLGEDQNMTIRKAWESLLPRSLEQEEMYKMIF